MSPLHGRFQSPILRLASAFLGATTLSIRALNMTTFSIVTQHDNKTIVTPRITLSIYCHYAEHCYVKCRYAECLVVMVPMSVITLSVVMPPSVDA